MFIVFWVFLIGVPSSYNQDLWLCRHISSFIKFVLPIKMIFQVQVMSFSSGAPFTNSNYIHYKAYDEIT